MDRASLLNFKKNILSPHLDFIKMMCRKVEGTDLERSWRKMLSCITNDYKLMSADQIHKMNRTILSLKEKHQTAWSHSQNHLTRPTNSNSRSPVRFPDVRNEFFHESRDPRRQSGRDPRLQNISGICDFRNSSSPVFDGVSSVNEEYRLRREVSPSRLDDYQTSYRRSRSPRRRFSPQRQRFSPPRRKVTRSRSRSPQREVSRFSREHSDRFQPQFENVRSSNTRSRSKSPQREFSHNTYRLREPSLEPIQSPDDLQFTNSPPRLFTRRDQSRPPQSSRSPNRQWQTDTRTSIGYRRDHTEVGEGFSKREPPRRRMSIHQNQFSDFRRKSPVNVQSVSDFRSTQPNHVEPRKIPERRKSVYLSQPEPESRPPPKRRKSCYVPSSNEDSLEKSRFKEAPMNPRFNDASVKPRFEESSRRSRYEDPSKRSRVEEPSFSSRLEEARKKLHGDSSSSKPNENVNGKATIMKVKEFADKVLPIEDKPEDLVKSLEKALGRDAFLKIKSLLVNSEEKKEENKKSETKTSKENDSDKHRGHSSTSKESSSSGKSEKSSTKVSSHPSGSSTIHELLDLHRQKRKTETEVKDSRKKDDKVASKDPPKAPNLMNFTIPKKTQESLKQSDSKSKDLGSTDKDSGSKYKDSEHSKEKPSGSKEKHSESKEKQLEPTSKQLESRNKVPESQAKNPESKEKQTGSSGREAGSKSSHSPSSNHSKHEQKSSEAKSKSSKTSENETKTGKPKETPSKQSSSKEVEAKSREIQQEPSPQPSTSQSKSSKKSKSSSKQSTKSTSAQPIKKTLSELDRLHLDINNSFIRDAVLKSGSRRQCTMNPPSYSDNCNPNGVQVEVQEKYHKQYDLQKISVQVDRLDLEDEVMPVVLNRDFVERHPSLKSALKSFLDSKEDNEPETEEPEEPAACAVITPEKKKKSPSLIQKIVKNRKRAAWSRGVISKRSKKPKVDDSDDGWEDIEEEPEERLKLKDVFTLIDSLQPKSKTIESISETVEDFSYTLCRAGKLKKCQICNFESVDNENFTNHIKSNHADRKWGKYCSKCDKIVEEPGDTLIDEFRHLLKHIDGKVKNVEGKSKKTEEKSKKTEEKSKKTEEKSKKVVEKSKEFGENSKQAEQVTNTKLKVRCLPGDKLSTMTKTDSVARPAINLPDPATNRRFDAVTGTATMIQRPSTNLQTEQPATAKTPEEPEDDDENLLVEVEDPKTIHGASNEDSNGSSSNSTTSSKNSELSELLKVFKSKEGKLKDRLEYLNQRLNVKIDKPKGFRPIKPKPTAENGNKVTKTKKTSENNFPKIISVTGADPFVNLLKAMPQKLSVEASKSDLDTQSALSQLSRLTQVRTQLEKSENVKSSNQAFQLMAQAFPQIQKIVFYPQPTQNENASTSVANMNQIAAPNKAPPFKPRQRTMSIDLRNIPHKVVKRTIQKNSVAAVEKVQKIPNASFAPIDDAAKTSTNITVTTPNQHTNGIPIVISIPKYALKAPAPLPASTNEGNAVEGSSETPKNDAVGDTTIASLRPWLCNNSFKSLEACKKMQTICCLSALFKCMASGCSFYTSDADIFEKHLKLHDLHESIDSCNYLMCPYCNVNMVSIPYLVQHVKEKHGDSRFQCKYCFFRAFNDFYVTFHHHNVYHKSQPRVAIECGPPVDKNQQMVKLIRKCLKVTVPQLLCVFCKKGFYGFKGLENHLEEHKKCQKVMKCGKCKKLVEKNTIVDHMRHCYRYGSFQCVYCRFGSDSFHCMDSHTATNHYNRLAIFCERPNTEHERENDLSSLSLKEVTKVVPLVKHLRFVNLKQLRNEENVETFLKKKMSIDVEIQFKDSAEPESDDDDVQIIETVEPEIVEIEDDESEEVGTRIVEEVGSKEVKDASEGAKFSEPEVESVTSKVDTIRMEVEAESTNVSKDAKETETSIAAQETSIDLQDDIPSLWDVSFEDSETLLAAEKSQEEAMSVIPSIQQKTYPVEQEVQLYPEMPQTGSKPSTSSSNKEAVTPPAALSDNDEIQIDDASLLATFRDIENANSLDGIDIFK